MISLKLFQNYGDINKTLEEMREKLRLYGLKLQPLILIVGPSLSNITSIYVVIDSCRYKVAKILNAVDQCYKAIHVLQAEYPIQCEQVWMLLQLQIFKQVTEWDKQFNKVDTIVRSLADMP